jgi:site-specific recombinase XerD
MVLIPQAKSGSRKMPFIDRENLERRIIESRLKALGINGINKIPKDKGRWYLLSLNGEGKIRTSTVSDWLYNAIDAVGISRNLKKHPLRHYHATQLWKATKDILFVNRRLGHAKEAIETTAIYIDLDIEELSSEYQGRFTLPME